jgi:hypothetical protein
LSVAPASTVIDLVHQAAELFSGLENRARETEARAHSLCKNALERLELAEKRIETVERERHEAIDEADGKLRDASNALEKARLRLVAAEDQVRAAEFRAQASPRRGSVDSDPLFPWLRLGKPSQNVELKLGPSLRSADRAPSPARVSQKREYFLFGLETIGDFAPKLFNLGV